MQSKTDAKPDVDVHLNVEPPTPTQEEADRLKEGQAIHPPEPVKRDEKREAEHKPAAPAHEQHPATEKRDVQPHRGPASGYQTR